MKYLAMLIVLLMPSVACAEFRHFNKWTDSEKVEFAIYTTLSYIDYKQTSWAMKQKDQYGNYVYEELNPIYGDRPSDKSLIVGQLIGIAVFYCFIGGVTDSSTKHLTKGILLGSKFTVVLHHENVGIHISKAF